MKVIKEIMKKPTFSAIFPHDKKEILFFDIETTGLSPKVSSLYMIGAMYYDAAAKCYQMVQWFADDYKSEAKILTAFLDLLEKYTYLYHFNGKTFDIPYIINKCEKHDIALSSHCEKILHDTEGSYSVDILACIRGIKKKLSINKANQTALEVWLGIHREDKYNGGELIPVYSKYIQHLRLKPEKAPELEHLLLLHNKDDMGGMLEVASILNYKTLFTDFTPNNKSIKDITFTENGKISISFVHDLHLPRAVTLDILYPKSVLFEAETFTAELRLSEMDGCLEIPIFKGILYHFYDNYKDYYYIPKQDTAIHKSVISSYAYDKEDIKKATRNTCYQKQEGFFIPSPSKQTVDCPREIYRFAAKDKLFFYQLSPDDFDLTNQNAADIWCKIITDTLRL